MIEKLLLKMRARVEIDEAEAGVLAGLVSETQEFTADQIVVRAEVEQCASNLLLDGLMCRYKDLANGERQIMELHVPGDFVDLHSFILKKLDHNVMALVPSRIAVVPHERLADVTREQPHLGRALWFSTLIDAAVHREAMVSLGRRTALSRTAHLLCEMHVRLEMVGMTEGPSYRLPLTQADLAECLGLTSVHVNRTLKDLRESGLATFQSGMVTIDDRARLERAAEFNPSYLYLERRRR